ncbi:MAG: undecaprenyldiphospho-muramoylpentapeptide beta-N-acetylglucosaminyltransferase [Bryobacteraceae bacterium]|nr:undecaprenyldiphospho-muramoylpentapeptide beta-N-acetylglucosaminyltransferase [Bryobacteraceae bacterium]MDW8379364.1 undecaprenyldiphospho-muramoylpentapeptide beta-N-acetylglucosaminyltransferase [Bryobacterales bacterium]
MKVRIRLRKRAEPQTRLTYARPKLSFLMVGGGTAGHVIPAIAVARELRGRGHKPFFIGTREGLEAKLVPKENFPLEFIDIGGLKRVGWRQTLRTLIQLPVSTWKSIRYIRKYRPAAVFSMGGYVAGPATIAAWLLGLPIVLMEPNAVPGLVNRCIGWVAKRALLSFPEAARHFPASRVEVTGLPVRSDFFQIPTKKPGAKITVLVTGGSRGSQRLNQAAQQSWAEFRERRVPIRWIHQTGAQDFERIKQAFEAEGCEGLVVPFLENMPQAFAQADLVICRSGAGTVSELAAAGKPSILVPFPFAADDHQLRNAESMAKAGAARLILDKECTGAELFHHVQELVSEPGLLEAMGQAARKFARPQAARRAAQILEEEALQAAGLQRG